MDGSCATIRPSVRRNLNTRYRDAASPAAVPYPASSSRAGRGCSAAVACASSPSRMDGSCATIRPSVRRNLNTTRRGGGLRGLRFAAFENGLQLRRHPPVGQAELEHQIPGRSIPCRSSLPGQIVPRGGGLELYGGGAALRRGGRLRGLRVVAFEDGRQLRHHPPVGQAELEHQIPGRSFPRRSPLPGQFLPRGGGLELYGGGAALRRWPARSALRRLRGWTVIAPPSARRSGGT